MTTRNLEPDKWRNGDEWHLVSRKKVTAVKKTPDR